MPNRDSGIISVIFCTMAERTSIYYDPARQGIDLNQLTVLAGSPSLDSNNKIILNAATIVHNHDVQRCEVRFLLTIPAVPTTGDSRRFGLFSTNKNSGVYFDINGNIFSGIANDSVANKTVSETMTFESSWATNEVEYKIVWEPDLIKFYVDRTRKAVLSLSSSELDISSIPLSVYVKNGNSDNMILGNFEIVGAMSYV